MRARGKTIMRIAYRKQDLPALGRGLLTFIVGLFILSQSLHRRHIPPTSYQHRKSYQQNGFPKHSCHPSIVHRRDRGARRDVNFSARVWLRQTHGLHGCCLRFVDIDRSKAHAQRGVPMYEHRYKWKTLEDMNELACSCPSRVLH